MRANLGDDTDAGAAATSSTEHWSTDDPLPRRDRARGRAGARALATRSARRHEMWDPQAEALARALPARPLRHARPRPAPRRRPARTRSTTLGGDVIDLLDDLEVERAHFAGLSLGGMTGMWLAINAPERIDKLVLLCTLAEDGPAGDVGATARSPSASRAPRRSSTATFERWFTDAYRAEHDLVRRGCEMFVGDLRRGLRELLRDHRADGPDRRAAAHHGADAGRSRARRTRRRRPTSTRR